MNTLKERILRLALIAIILLVIASTHWIIPPNVKPAGVDYIAAVGNTHQVREWEKAYGLDRANGWSLFRYYCREDPVGVGLVSLLFLALCCYSVLKALEDK